MSRLFPDEFVSSIYKINYRRLKDGGIKNLIFDIDNTLVAYNEKHAPEELINHFEKLKKMGFKICLVSNNNYKRVTLFNEKLKLDNVYSAMKPLKLGIKRAMRYLDAENHNTCMIGDQVFTDVLVGSRCGLYTILVKAVIEKDEFSVKFKRGSERLVLRRYSEYRRGLKQE